MKTLKLKLGTLAGIFLIVFATIAPNSVFATSSDFNVPSHTEEFYVNDFAQVFTPEQKAKMQNDAVKLAETRDGIQVVVSTVKSLEGQEIEKYAKVMYDQYRIGKDSMGILILLSVDDRDVRIETGYKMQTYITDSMSGRLIDNNGLEYFKNNDFGNGLVVLQEATIAKIIEEVPGDWATKEPFKLEINLWPFFSFVLIVVAFGAVVVGIVILVKKAKNSIREKKEREIAEILEEERRKYEAEIEKKEEQERILNIENKMLRGENDQLNKKLNQVKEVHPSIDKEIKEHIEDGYREEAERWDNRARISLFDEPTANNSDKYEYIINGYNSLPSEVRKYVKTDISGARTKLREANRLRDVAIATGAATAVAAIVKKFSKGDRSNYNEIANAYNLYQGLTPSQKKSFTKVELLPKLSELYDSAIEDYSNYEAANEVEQEIQSALSRAGYSADRDDLSTLEMAKREYSNLSIAQQGLIAYGLIQSLDSKIRQAREDQENYERRQLEEEARRRREEEERRRRMSSSSSSSSSSFSGFGGHSGGGGASRHF